ncbi:hypothetical protein AAC03nite_28120 [Alicyclobacillus acidoterrestris]|nr:hypothetical protein AAC03nite_28120 [Alicyclobacillus acidoterrestris]
MADFEIDDSQIAEFIRNLDLLQQEFPNQARAFMRRIGDKAKLKVKSVAGSSVPEDTGDYMRSITRGKVWVEDGSTYNVRVYPKQKLAWYALLLEYGWIHTGHKPDKKKGQFVPGFHVFERATQQFQLEFYATAEAEFAKIIDKLP